MCEILTGKVYIFLSHDVGIQKHPAMTTLALNAIELESFEPSLVFFLLNSGFSLVFFF